MRKFLQRLLRKPIGMLADKFSSRPDKTIIHQSFTALKKEIDNNPGKKGLKLSFTNEEKFIIFSDQHKGAKDGSDIFALAEKNYLAAMQHYNKQGFTYINLGDGEELWGNTLEKVTRNNVASFKAEQLFVNRKAFIKIFGNHDLYWDNDPFADSALQKIYGEKIPIYEGVLLQTILNGNPKSIFMTHGHQGDLQSDGNWFSKWFVANVWGPFELYMQMNLNTPSVNDHLKTLHNEFMYEWSSMQTDLLLITGHTHQPVFASLTQLEKLYKELSEADPSNKDLTRNLQDKIDHRISKGDRVPDFKAYKPYYFNSGCCCFNDGDITGIEIEDGYIRLVKWEFEGSAPSLRVVFEERELEQLFTVSEVR